MEHDIAATPFDSAWLSHLRDRFAEIASRRVPEDAVEDLVHDAIGIVLAKGPAETKRPGGDSPPLRWCFLVLRNVIGNWYQKRRDLAPVEGLSLVDDRPDPLVSLAAEERARTVRGAVAELRLKSRECADWLWALAQGTKAGSLAESNGIDRTEFYRRIYRCRQALAGILERKGVSP